MCVCFIGFHVQLQKQCYFVWGAVGYFVRYVGLLERRGQEESAGCIFTVPWVPGSITYFFCLVWIFTPLLSSFWTSRCGLCGHRPFYSPPLPFLALNIFISHKAQQYHASSMFHRVLPTHALVLSVSLKHITALVLPNVPWSHRNYSVSGGSRSWSSVGFQSRRH